MAARNSGVTKIIAADILDSRLELALLFGATHRINSGSSDLVAEVAKITGSTVDFAFDCTGVIAVIESLAQTVGMLVTLRCWWPGRSDSSGPQRPARARAHGRVARSGESGGVPLLRSGVVPDRWLLLGRWRLHGAMS
jgi:threonine dehydrogenase-like Zn-dependent dehydrogenase